MGWFSFNSDDRSGSKDEIRSQIRDLESDLRYLEREADNARYNSEVYLNSYSDHIRENNYIEDSYSMAALAESNYWGNVNADTQRKIDDLEDKIRDLEREL